MTHNATSGVAHFAAADDRECIALIRELLGYLPSNNLDDPPRRRRPIRVDREDAALDRSCRSSPTSRTTCTTSSAVVDDGAFLEVHRALRAEHHRRLRAAGRRPVGHRRQPARGAGRVPGH
jgi:propionyl-CoA carboxylase beta chain